MLKLSSLIVPFVLLLASTAMGQEASGPAIMIIRAVTATTTQPTGAGISPGISVTTAEFSTMDTCKAAASQIKLTGNYLPNVTFEITPNCYKK